MPPLVSLTMIVRNEEANLAACLASVAGLVDEIIVVDTGSTDGTREVAARFGAQVHEFAWCDDFSAARNEALRLARGQWIFWLDGDEWLAEPDRQRFADLIKSLPDNCDGYIMSQLCLEQSSLPGAPVGGDTAVEQIRLFRNHPQIRWRHRVYEQVASSIRALGGSLWPTNVVIQHAGYSETDVHQSKIERNLRLARLESRDQPDDPYVLYVIGMFEQLLGRDAESLVSLKRALERLPGGTNYGAKLCALLAQGHQRTGRPHEALAYCRLGRERFPGDAELRMQECILVPEAADLGGAEASLSGLLAASAVPDPRSGPDRELLTQLRHHLATLYRSAGRPGQAAAQWQAAVQERGDFALGWLELGELLLGAGHWAELEQVLTQLEHVLHRSEDAAVLRARGLMARGAFSDAQTLLHAVIAQSPRSLRPRIALSQVLLLEGNDWSAARQALLDVLELDPGNAQARHNLAIHEGRKDAAAAPSGSRGPAPGAG